MKYSYYIKYKTELESKNMVYILSGSPGARGPPGEKGQQGEKGKEI